MVAPNRTQIHAIKAWVLYATFLTAMSLIGFGHLTDHPFDLDDGFYLADSAKSSADWAFFFSADKHFAGRPVTELVLLFGYLAAGENPAFFHILAIGFHLLASLLLALACSSLGADRMLSWSTGLLFLVGVAHFHAVFWISAIAYPLAFCLSALALIGYARYTETADGRWLAGLYAAALAGVLAHIAAAAVWPFCLLIAWQQDRRQIPRLLPLGLILGGLIVWAVLYYPHTAQVQQASRVPELLDIGRNTLFFCSRLLSTAHWLPLAIHRFETWELALGVLTILFSAIPIWRGEIRPCAWILLTTLPFVTMSPDFVQTIPSGPARYLYFSSAGTAVLLALFLRGSVRRLGGGRERRTQALLGTALLSLCISSCLALRQAQFSSFYSAGRHFLNQGRIDDAEFWLQRAAAGSGTIVPLEETYYHLASLALVQDRDPRPLLDQGLERVHTAPILLIFKGILEIETPDPAMHRRGLERLNALIQRYPDPQRQTVIALTAATVYANLGARFSRHQDYTKASMAYQKSLTYDPNRIHTLIALAKAAIKAGQFAPAELAALHAAELNPDDYQAHYLAALAQYGAGNRETAIASGRRARRLNPTIELSFLSDPPRTSY